MASLSFSQLEALWVQAGGSKAAAPVAAAIALAESGGNPDALDNNPATGDYSVGLWQINYYGNLAPGRTAEFGSPQQVASPLANAKAAVAISGNGANFTPWTTYTSGAYQANLPGGGAGVSLGSTPAYSRGARPSGGGGSLFSTLESVGGDVLGGAELAAGGFPGIGAITGLFGGAVDGIGSVTDALKVILWLFNPVHWLMAFEILLGVLLMILGLFFLGKEAAGVEGSDDIGGARDVAKTIGLGALIPVAGEARVARAAAGGRKARQARRAASAKLGSSRLADRTPGDQRRAGFTLDADKPRRKASAGAGPGDTIPF